MRTTSPTHEQHGRRLGIDQTDQRRRYHADDDAHGRARSLADQWHVVCRVRRTSPTGPSASRLLGRDVRRLAVPVGRGRRRTRSLPAPRGAAVARPRATTAACRARTTAGRSATAAAASPCRRRARRAGAAEGPPGDDPRRRSATAWCGCAPATPVGDDPGDRGATTTRPTGASTPASRMWRHLGAADDRQLPRHLALPVRPHRHVRHRHRTPRCRSSRSTPLDDDFAGYEYEVEVGQRRRRDGVGPRRPTVIKRRMTTGFDLPFTVRSTIHYETGLDHLILLCSTPDRRRPHRTSRS